ncbi:hypothetical protein M3J09_013356 [Ascochyta lentis]
MKKVFGEITVLITHPADANCSLCRQTADNHIYDLSIIHVLSSLTLDLTYCLGLQSSTSLKPWDTEYSTRENDDIVISRSDVNSPCIVCILVPIF